MKPVTVLIVDDSALVRTLFTQMLSAEPDIRVVGTATDPLDAREKIKQLNPDVLTLDIEMPKMDGLTFLEKIMRLRPMPVIMASTLTQKGAEKTLQALELGAVDYISKTSGNQTAATISHLKDELINKVRAAAEANLASHRKETPAKPAILTFEPPGNALPLIAIGSSTGGVEALRDIFQILPANCPPIVMAQHMPEQFTPSFAARLNSISQVQVAEAKNGAVLAPGHAYLAPGNHHVKIKRQGGEFVCQLEDSEKVSGHRPSVDVLFRSVAEAAGPDAIGVILTGMGKDGAEGLLAMRERGAYTIGQNQTSCVVYGMPKAASALGAVRTELPLQDIASHMLRYAEQEGRRAHAS